MHLEPIDLDSHLAPASRHFRGPRSGQSWDVSSSLKIANDTFRELSRSTLLECRLRLVFETDPFEIGMPHALPFASLSHHA